jgi:hypothetical protein
MDEYIDNYVPDEPSGYGDDNNPFDPSNPYGVYSNYGQDTLSAMGVANDTNPSMSLSGLSKLFSGLKNFGGKALDFAGTNQGIMAILAALAAASDRQRASGGGAAQAYAGPKPVSRTMTQGRYGPIARYAANGGLMQAYAQGGRVQMEDGGFVMTEKAVKEAGKLAAGGITSLLPGAKMIRGPGTGTSDSIPAVIHGANSSTPARVSNGEAYVPKHVVDQNGGSQQMYALMNKLQRRV